MPNVWYPMKNLRCLERGRGLEDVTIERGRPEMFSTEIPRSLCIASRVGDIGTALLVLAYLAHCQSSFVNICCSDGRRSQR